MQVSARSNLLWPDGWVGKGGPATPRTRKAIWTSEPNGINMPEGETVAIRSHGQGAVTADVTYPHWQESHRA